MRFHPALPLMAAGLFLSTAVFAQNPPDGAAPPQPPVSRQPQAPFNSIPVSTQSSRIRAFSAAPDGQVRSLYLRNGSVVNVSPDLGRQLSTQAQRGARISVTGTRTTVNGQPIILANQITMNSQTYTARLQEPEGRLAFGPAGARGIGPHGGPAMAPPPPPAPDDRLKARGGPRGPRADGGPVPPPPPRPEKGAQGAPPPPPNQGAPMGPQGGPKRRNTPPPPPSPTNPAAAPGDQAPANPAPPPHPPTL